MYSSSIFFIIDYCTHFKALSILVVLFIVGTDIFWVNNKRKMWNQINCEIKCEIK